MSVAISIDKERITEFCERNGIRRLALFGSVLRDDFGPDSDVDILLEMRADAGIGYLRLMQLQDELSRIIGRRADLRTPFEISGYFRDDVLRQAVPVYEQTQ